MSAIFDKFTTHLRQSLRSSFTLAIEERHKEVTPLHFLFGLIEQKGSVAAELLRKAGMTREMIMEAMAASLPRVFYSASAPPPPALGVEAENLLTKSAVIAVKFSHHYIGTEHLLGAIFQTNNALVDKLLARYSIDKNILKQQLENVLMSAHRFPKITSQFSPLDQDDEMMDETAPLPSPAVEATIARPKNGKRKALEFFTNDLTHPRALKQMDPIIGRDKEIQRLIQILCRRYKNNPILLGDPGVGKTAIVEGLAQKISTGDVPDILQNRKVLRLDLGLLIAGTIYRGEFEGRLKQLLDEVKSDPNIILFIDEVHTIVGAGSASGTLDAANILKPALARGEIRCIGATTYEEYKKSIESDAALERRFQPITVAEPSADETLQILQGLRHNYEIFHGVKISYEAIETAVRLAERYAQDKFFPDKAIDLLDEAAAAKKLTFKGNKNLKELKQMEREFAELETKKQTSVMEEKFDEAFAHKNAEEKLSEKIQKLKSKISGTKTRAPEAILSADDITAVVNQAQGGIPMNFEEDEDLLNLEDNLKTRVVGQDEAVRAISQTLHRARAGLSDPRRPLASFLFAGPSGVGKTETAKALAEIYFKNPDAFVRVDMSEFHEPFQVSKLLGAPAGYVGYKEGNKFTDKIKHHPHSVILFDDIDKAHPDIFNIFLQILDEGHLTDGVGRKINFKNTVIIMTAHLGEEFLSARGLGFGDKDAEGGKAPKIHDPVGQNAMGELKNRFRPEFLNRIDQILFFKPLTKADLEKIIELQMNELEKRLAKKNISVQLEDNTLSALARQAQEMDQGGRAIKKLLQQEIEEPLAEYLLRHKAKVKSKLTAHRDHGHIIFD